MPFAYASGSTARCHSQRSAAASRPVATLGVRSAVSLPVSFYQVTVPQTAALFPANSVGTTLSCHLIGQLTAQFGAWAVLGASFCLLAVISAGCPPIRSLPLLVLFLIIDYVVFGSALALKTCFWKMALTPVDRLDSFGTRPPQYPRRRRYSRLALAASTGALGG